MLDGFDGANMSYSYKTAQNFCIHLSENEFDNYQYDKSGL